MKKGHYISRFRVLDFILVWTHEKFLDKPEQAMCQIDVFSQKLLKIQKET